MIWVKQKNVENKSVNSVETRQADGSWHLASDTWRQSKPSNVPTHPSCQIGHHHVLLFPSLQYNFKPTNVIYLGPVPAFLRPVVVFLCLFFLLFRCCPGVIRRNDKRVLDILNSTARAWCCGEVLLVRSLYPLNPGTWRLDCWALAIVRARRWRGEFLQWL
jgi:hypothetical protein